ncbi:WSC domain-containing protein [Truncatella angustata]|uniref:Peroxidase n=1 Tax=Truncatella angustata TaxID=152316 RepID=A0A9P8RKZ9_9PEZI|nr:WSC domain-containing protein [Truncatella angustata]KAH6645225.1 WSC domain-containing protein [Truncatella angustata]
MHAHWLILYGLLQAGLSHGAYIWPSEHDFLEDILYLQSGYIHFGFIDGVSPCSFGTNIEGRQNAAEWIRTAYHDMSTHDAAAGTGGLDASILFELDREENPGSAFNNTFGFLSNFYTSRSGAADLLAMSVVIATGSCGGLAIPFRAGRIDAAEAGPVGVPEPQQDLTTHINRFATAGFNISDMITMVACGHTLGGIHGEDFPEVTGNGTIGQVSHFEGSIGTSFAKFDNAVVTQYLDDSTENPLVVGTNETMNSDKRVFGADANQTMNVLVDETVFQTKCENILERMINTVPATVTLSDPLDPIDIKPYITLMALNSNGTIDFQGRVRLRVTSSTGRDYNDIGMNLTYTDRYGVYSSNVITTSQGRYQGGLSSGLFGELFAWFEFSTVLDPKYGISAFNVHLITLSTGLSTTYANGGRGFPARDDILYQQPQSCVDISAVDGSSTLTISAAVRTEEANETVALDLVQSTRRQGIILDALNVETTSLQKTTQVVGDYSIFSLQIPMNNIGTTFDLVLRTTYEVRIRSQNTRLLIGTTCQAL